MSVQDLVLQMLVQQTWAPLQLLLSVHFGLQLAMRLATGQLLATRVIKTWNKRNKFHLQLKDQEVSRTTTATTQNRTSLASGRIVLRKE
jgi:hypothetical protein